MPSPPNVVIQNCRRPEASSLRDLTITKHSAASSIVHTAITGPGEETFLIIVRIAILPNQN